MAAFYRQFGWPEASTSVPEHVVFQCSNGVVLGLFSEPVFEARFGSRDEAARAFALTVHVEDEAAVNRAHREVAQFDDVRELDPEPRALAGVTGSASETGRKPLGSRRQVRRSVR
jgi:hypothetical protein